MGGTGTEPEVKEEPAYTGPTVITPEHKSQVTETVSGLRDLADKLEKAEHYEDVLTAYQEAGEKAEAIVETGLNAKLEEIDSFLPVQEIAEVTEEVTTVSETVPTGQEGQE